MSLGLSIFVLFISLMQSVNGAQFLKQLFYLLFVSAAAAAVFQTVIVPLKTMCALL